MGPDASYLSLFQDNPNLTPGPKQRLEVALVVPPGTAPSGEIGVQTHEGGLHATARVTSGSKTTPHNGTRWWPTGCREAVTSRIIVRPWSFT